MEGRRVITLRVPVSLRDAVQKQVRNGGKDDDSMNQWCIRAIEKALAEAGKVAADGSGN